MDGKRWQEAGEFYCDGPQLKDCGPNLIGADLFNG
jgi:hypothetical protein